jgi:hypothetical protein
MCHYVNVLQPSAANFSPSHRLAHIPSVHHHLGVHLHERLSKRIQVVLTVTPFFLLSLSG